MNPETSKKYELLKKILKDTGGCAVAFSGGVDSSVLLSAAHEVLGERCLAVIATSSTYPDREYRRALKFVQDKSIKYKVIVSEELDIPGYSENPPDRCYHCKKELFEKVYGQAMEHGLKKVADGTNADDMSDYRPGMKAARELEIISPLLEAGLGKSEIREIAREIYSLDVADKPAMACLASRFPYGSEITREKLEQVGRIEEYLETKGLRQFRARHHGDILRLELGREEMKLVGDEKLRKDIAAFARNEGFSYITLDIEGYRTGSMNEVLPKKSG